MTLPVPEGWRVRLDARTQVLDEGRILVTPTGRLLRLGPAAPAAMRALAAGTADERGRRLGRALLDAGAGHPEPPGRSLGDLTVVIPVKDRTESLERCLRGLRGLDVVVVDDGSEDPAAVKRICDRFGAGCVHRANGGPAAARNTALPLLTRDFVAFVDSDCRVSAAALAALRGHLDDPAVAAAAPRVTGGVRSPLDLGSHPAGVGPGGAVSYVPTACLVLRRDALVPFDEDLRYGEDVDLVWRLVDAGWQVRYDPSIEVAHDEPERLVDRLVRRFRYGTSAAPLSVRHPDRLAPVVLPPWPTVAVGLLLLKRPWLAVMATAITAARINTVVHRPATSARLAGGSVVATGLGIGRVSALAGPLGWYAAVRRKPAAALVLAPLVVEWRARRTGAALLTFVGNGLLDQAAYGAGVVRGCVEHRTVRPLLPRTTSSS